MKWTVVFLVITILNMVACQHLEKKGRQNSSLKKANSEKKMTNTSRSFPKIKELETDNNVFKRSNDLVSNRTFDSIQTSGPIELTDKEKLYFELVGEKLDNLNEINTYYKIVEKYQKSDEVALNAYLNVLVKKYPKSIYCDNAFYLQGMLYFSQKKFGESLASFQRILNNYPQSNKAVSALFAKGIVFKKMNLNKQSLQLLAQVINRYPGSPESARAEVEVKLMTQ